MFEALLFFLIAVAIIMGGAMILLQSARKPKIPKKIKSPEELDKEDEEYRS
ncbi:MAG: hypothetical protein GY829_06125 [Gammaproteobacteria bacterium]|nr:hypothetical protein [Gammaproteobacteria bacterium]